MPKSATPATAVPVDTDLAGAGPASAAAGPEPASYELALAELERLVQAMEGEQLPLDQVLRSYQRGAQLLAFCRGRLDAVEQQVKVLEDGQLKAWTGNP
jgi:exodeoxyribonuclease VII small subunit